jgi:hypothetical protein
MLVDVQIMRAIAVCVAWLLRRLKDDEDRACILPGSNSLYR